MRKERCGAHMEVEEGGRRMEGRENVEDAGRELGGLRKKKYGMEVGRKN